MMTRVESPQTAAEPLLPESRFGAAFGMLLRQYVAHARNVELFNFRTVGRSLYGFAKGGSRTSAFNLNRIDPKAGRADKLEHVTVIFLAKRRSDGQRVVGWYENATVYHKWENHPIQPSYKKRVAFCIKAASERNLSGRKDGPRGTRSD